MRILFRLVFLFGASCLSALPIRSQSDNRPVTVSGDVLTAEGNRRIEGASVTVTDSAGNQIEQEFTNGAGIFRFVGLRRAQYILKVLAEGYQPAELHVDLSFSSDRGITIYLKSLHNDSGPAPSGPPISAHELSLPAAVRDALASGRQAPGERLAVGDLEIDPRKRRVSRGGRKIELTAKEYALLDCLLRNCGEVMSRTLIAEQVWDMNFDSDTNVVDVFIGYLRRKLEANGGPRLLHTVRGVGFVLRAPA